MKLTGCYDCHIHGGPESIPRKYDFVTLSREMQEAGMAGFVAKSHFFSTVPFACLADTYGAKTVWGSVVLNHFVGGINPNAVRASLGLKRNGENLLRIVWMPTMHARSNLDMLRRKGTGYDIPPEWTAGAIAPGAQRLDSIEPIDIREPKVQDRLKETLDVIATAGVCLATGHLSRDEVFYLVPLAKKLGVRSVILTHPIYASTEMTDIEMRQLTEYENVFAEMCYVFMQIDNFTPEEMIGHIKGVGCERIILSTDSGQTFIDPPYVCMQKYINLLSEAGLSDEMLQIMVRANPRRALGFS